MKSSYYRKPDHTQLRWFWKIGLLGETQYNGSYKGKEAPVLTLDADAEFVAEGRDLVLTGQDARTAEYFEKITGIYVNQSWKELTEDQYSVEDGKLVIKDSVLTLGTNTVEIKAEGFKNNTLSVEYKKVLEENLSLVSDKEQYNRGRECGSDRKWFRSDFLKNLNAVKVDGKKHLMQKVLQDLIITMKQQKI